MNINRTIIFRILSIFLLLVIASCWSNNIWEYWDTNKKESVFVFSETEFDFGVLKQSEWVVLHDFHFIYNGKETIKITGTPGSCLCTKAFVDKTSYNPGESWVLTVEFNPNLHGEPSGRFFKTAAILTEPSLDVIPEVKIWQEIDLDLGEEAFELNAIHKNDDNHHGDLENKTSSKEVSLLWDGIKVPEIANNGLVPPLENIWKDQVRSFKLTAKEVLAPLADGVEYNYWTYDGTVPGTFMRVQEGDTVEITFENLWSNHNKHSIDLHAVNGPGWWAGATQVYPGEEKTFRFQALNPGIYIYHCATDVVPEHIANGMYWLIIVEPKGWFSKVDREYAVVQWEFYTILDRWEQGITQLSSEKMYSENPEYIVFNGRVGALTTKESLKANVGDKIRLYVWNGGVSKVSSFHVIWEIFDTVYPEWWTPVQNNIQTTVVPAGWATIVEFVVDVPWTYKIVDHALSRLSKWALAEIQVEGKENKEIFDAE